MVSASVSQLKAKLSEHLRRVKAGEEVLVTERGRAVAVLTPVPRSEGRDPELQRLIDAAIVRPAKRRLTKDFWDQPRGRDPKGAVLKALLEERRGGR